MSLLLKSARFLSGALKSAAKETITYTRGAESITLDAIPGRHENRLDLIEDEQASAREFDWIICADEIVLAAGKVAPEKGDVITWVEPGGTTLTYKVVPGTQDRCFRPCDQLGILYRVHTVLVDD